MKNIQRLGAMLLAVGLWISLTPLSFAQTTSPNQLNLSPVQHDGRHDFDFEIGTWKAHVKKLLRPLSGSSQWDQLSGTVVTRSLPMLEGWNESEMRVESPTTHTKIEILAVRLYNPTSGQWSIYGSSIKTGTFDPPEVGRFDRGSGEFYAQDIFQGKVVYIRFMWQSVNADKTHFEQAFSADGGKTWETNWIYDGIRVNENHAS